MSYSLEQKITNLKDWILKHKGLADVPFAVVDNEPISPNDALKMLTSNLNVDSVVIALETLNVDPEEQDWLLAEAYFKKMAAMEKGPRVYTLSSPSATSPLETLPPTMTFQEMLEHIRARDAIGVQLLETHNKLLELMRSGFT